MPDTTGYQKIAIVTLLATTLLLAIATAWLGWTAYRDRHTYAGAGGDANLPSLMPDPTPLTAEGSGEFIEARLFFLRSDRQFLQTESRRIPVYASPGDILLQEKLRYVVEALIDGPQREGSLRILPPSVRIRGVYWMPKQKVVVVDLSQEVLSDHPGQLFSEWATLFGLANSIITQDPSRIRAVQILVEGHAVTDSNTVWDWSQPLELDTMFVPLGE